MYIQYLLDLCSPLKAAALCCSKSLPLPSSSVRQLLHLPPPAVDNPASSFDAHLLLIRVLGAYILPD